MHTQIGSNIKYSREIPKVKKTPRKDILEDTYVLAVIIMKSAVIIKEKKPTFNAQTEGCDRLTKELISKVKSLTLL